MNWALATAQDVRSKIRATIQNIWPAELTARQLTEDLRTYAAVVIDSVPDVILLDWKMPRLDGISAAKRIRKQVASSQILMLSGAPLETTVLDGLDEGIDGFVNKDISPNDLAHAIRVIAVGKP